MGIVDTGSNLVLWGPAHSRVNIFFVERLSSWTSCVTDWRQDGWFDQYWILVELLWTCFGEQDFL